MLMCFADTCMRVYKDLNADYRLANRTVHSKHLNRMVSIAAYSCVLVPL